MSGFLPYIHNLRGFAIIFVVCVHARGYDTDWISHPGVNRFLDTIFDPSEGNGTVLFLFIGGFLFQHLTHKRFEFKKYLEQKFKVIILPYIIISIPIILLRINTGFNSLSLPPDFEDRSQLYQLFHYLFTGAHMAPFWFIPAIVIIYLTAPLLHAIDNSKFYNYIFPFIFLLSLFTFRPAHNANPFLAYLHFVPAYLTGMWASFNRHRILAAEKKLLYPLIAIFIVFSILDLSGKTELARLMTFEKVLEGQIILFNIYILKAVILCFILMLILYRLQHKSMPLIELLGHYSFGIFFVHYIFISLFRNSLLLAGITIDFSVLTYFTFALFVMLVSIMVVYLLKKLTGHYSRYLIGS